MHDLTGRRALFVGGNSGMQPSFPPTGRCLTCRCRRNSRCAAVVPAPFVAVRPWAPKPENPARAGVLLARIASQR